MSIVVMGEQCNISVRCRILQTSLIWNAQDDVNLHTTPAHLAPQSKTGNLFIARILWQRKYNTAGGGVHIKFVIDDKHAKHASQ